MYVLRLQMWRKQKTRDVQCSVVGVHEHKKNRMILSKRYWISVM